MSSDVVGSMVVVEGKGDTEKPVDREKVFFLKCLF